MSNPNNNVALIAPAVFGASFTLIAILVGVAGILVGEIKQAGPLVELVTLEKALLWGVVTLVFLNAWCAFWSLRVIGGNDASQNLFIWPMLFQPWVISFFLLIWVGLV